MRVHKSKYFYGNKISDYGLENGYVDYRTLAKAFEGVLANGIIEKTNGIIGYWEQESGMIDNSEETEELQEQLEDLKYQQIDIMDMDNDYEENSNYCALQTQIEELEEQIEELEEEQEESYNTEIYQYFIVDYNGARILEECNEIVFYNEELDLYVWGVTHWGTSWDYVLTDIKLELDEE